MSIFTEEWAENGLPLVGVIHLAPLPGSPGNTAAMTEIADLALRDMRTLESAGFDGLVIENIGDLPFTAGRVAAHTVAQMATISQQIIDTSNLPVGINVLRNDGLSAMAIAAACGARFIRVNVLCGATLTDQGIVHGIAHDLLRLQSELGAGDISLFADIQVKHAAPISLEPLPIHLADIRNRGGAAAFIVTGLATGYPPAVHDAKEIATLSAGTPLFIGSGVTAANVCDYIPFAQGIIVGTSIRRDDVISQPIDGGKAAEFVASARSGTT